MKSASTSSSVGVPVAGIGALVLRSGLPLLMVARPLVRCQNFKIGPFMLHHPAVVPLTAVGRLGRALFAAMVMTLTVQESPSTYRWLKAVPAVPLVYSVAPRVVFPHPLPPVVADMLQ